MSLSDAVGAPAPVTIGGKQYTASPLDLYALGGLEQAVRVQIIAIAQQGIEGLSDADKDRLIDKAMDKASAITYEGPEVQGYMKSPPGLCHLISLSLKPQHPDMTPAAVGKAFAGKVKDMQAVVDTIAFISGFADAKAAAKKEKGDGAGDGKTFPPEAKA